jgi:glycosyltransferase involved in cell wall biosynthesis
MRILYIITGSPEKLDQIFAKRQAESLRNAGIPLDVFYLKTYRSMPLLLSEIARLRRVVKETEPDIVHAQFGTMTGAAGALAAKGRFVVSFRGSDLNPATDVGPLRMHLGHLFSRMAALRASRIICVSRQLRERLWWARGRVDIIPSPVNLDLFRPIPRAKVRAALGWRARERVVLFNATKDPIGKGIRIAGEAVRIAERSMGPIRLELLHGAVPPDEMPLYYNGADCLLVASAWEGSPNVVKEAMACNLPVVSSRVGDVEERLKDVFPSGVTERDPLKLGDVLVRVLTTGLRSNGRERVAHLSLDRTTKRLIAVYEKVMAGDRIRRRGPEPARS